jgi:hypothetical protein
MSFIDAGARASFNPASIKPYLYEQNKPENGILYDLSDR